MMAKPKWEKINRNGLKTKYEISETGFIRTASLRSKIHIYLDDNGRRYVILYCFGVKKQFFVDQLLYDTFKILPPEMIDRHVLKDGKLLQKPSQFSDNEEDYGRGDNKRHWKEIKDFLKMKRKIEDSEQNNEEQ